MTPAGGDAAKYPDVAEIPTDGRRVGALGPAPLGALGAALQRAPAGGRRGGRMRFSAWVSTG